MEIFRRGGELFSIALELPSLQQLFLECQVAFLGWNAQNMATRTGADASKLQPLMARKAVGAGRSELEARWNA